MSKIEWRTSMVAGYDVSRDGQVRSWRNRHGGRREEPVILQPLRSKSGHRYVLLPPEVGSRSRKFWVHHLVLVAFVGPRPTGQEARHLNDDPDDNRAENLLWGTRSENQRDAVRNGGRRTGAAADGATLTIEQVQVVRASRRPSRAVAAELGVSHTTIQKVRRGDRYRCG